MNHSAVSRVWKCGSYELLLARPVIMGIVNVTPDSFSDGGEHADAPGAIRHGLILVREGAGLIDVGGESTRPGSEPIPAAEELDRVLPVVEALASAGVPASVDTRHPVVAAACLKAGASVINDISGFTNSAMVEIASGSECGVVVMHMLGEPKTMQVLPPHYDDVAAEVADFLLSQAAMLEACGVARGRIALDPGIGFGKTLEHNLSLIRGIPELAAQGYPVLVGASRKRFIGEITGVDDPKQRVSGSIAAALEATRLGAAIVRVHDVAQTAQALAVAAAIRS